MSVVTEKALTLKVADAVWIAAAMLHRERPKAEGFTVHELVAKVEAEGLTDKQDSSVYLHANQHCVANRPPNEAKLRMLFETKDGLRRLFCQSDSSHAERDGRFTPKPSDIPTSFWPLLDWYQEWCVKRRSREIVSDPLLFLAGSGKGMWSEDAVQHVSHLRAD